MVVISVGAVISSPNSLTKRDPEDPGNGPKLDQTGRKVFYIAGITSSFVNMIGSSIMIYLTIRETRRKNETFTPSRRFPLYMAIMDFGTSAVTLPNLFYPMEKNYLMNEKWCISLGFATSLLIMTNMMLMASLALITYLRICKRNVVNLGKKDWILFVSILFPALTISFVTWWFNGFGADTYWCFMNQDAESGSRVNLIALIVFAYVVAMTTSFCYMSVINRIHNVEAMLTSAKFTRNSMIEKEMKHVSVSWSKIKKSTHKISPEKSSELKSSKRSSNSTVSTTSSTSVDGLEIRPPSCFYGPPPSRNDNMIATTAQKRAEKNIAIATRKMSSYIFLQLLQYTPIIIYSLCFLLNQMQTWVYVITIVMLNLGGVAKSLAFMKNEILCYNENGKERKSGRTISKYKVTLNDSSKSFESGTLSNNSYDQQQQKDNDAPFISINLQEGFSIDCFPNDHDNLENRNDIALDFTAAGQDQ